MTINGMNGVNTQAGQVGMNQATDSYSRNIQKQIENAQKQLQELSSNENMTQEEKMKKRQEIQQQISELNMQLRQHKVEQRKEKQQAKGTSMDDMLGGTRNVGSESTGFSQASMTAIISADNSIKQAKVQGSVATSMKGRVGVLESEIKHSHGGNVEKKKAELADIEQKAQAADASSLSTLAGANKTMEEAAQADSKDTKTTSAKGEGSEENVSDADTQEKIATGSGTVNPQSGVFVSGSTSVAETTAIPQQPTAYTSVDIRL